MVCLCTRDRCMAAESWGAASSATQCRAGCRHQARTAQDNRRKVALHFIFPPTLECAFQLFFGQILLGVALVLCN